MEPMVLVGALGTTDRLANCQSDTSILHGIISVGTSVLHYTVLAFLSTNAVQIIIDIQVQRSVSSLGFILATLAYR